MGTSNSQLISDSLIGYITSERLDLVEGLLNSFKDPSQICNMRNNKSGSTPIMVAIFIGNVNIVSYLLTYDIDLCAKDIRGKLSMFRFFDFDDLKIKKRKHT